jgi:broad specificity phosphatase PhoE
VLRKAFVIKDSPTEDIQGTEQASQPCTMHLVRHGTTTMNVENRYRGRRDIPLDAQGYQDAVDAARELSNVGLTAVYSGRLRRTIATAQIIADEARVPDIRILHGLINVDYGAWEGLTSQEAEMYDPVAFKLYKTAPSKAVCPNGERLADAQSRMLEALTLIGSRHPGEHVAVISHAVMIRLVVASITKVNDEHWRIPVGRGSLTTMHFQDGEVSLERLPGGTDVD